jgi:epoxide hydrolase 4
MEWDELVTHRLVDVGDVRLHVAEAGEGPLVVLLHGFPEFWYSWRHQIRALAEAGYRAVAPDLRGYNLSEKPPALSAYRAQALVADVAGLIAACGEQRATIVGHDWGGFVAWITALTRPDLVERLVICNAPHPARFRAALRTPEQVLRSSYMLFFQLPVLPDLLLGAGRGAALRWLLRTSAARRDAFTDTDLARYAEAYSEPGAITGGLAYYRWMGRQMLAQRGASRRKRTVTAPTLILWGTRDAVLPVQLADPGPDLAPDRRLELVDGAGHFVQSDAPERVNAALLAFLAQ